MRRKIINDPVYGFITINNPLVHQVIAHPWYQRLRRIQQMALAQLVYPGAVHTRLHHSLGAYHLMCNALGELKSKGVEITDDECTGAQVAILLHDVGHGPCSHALESTVIQGVGHEEISLLIMKEMNRQFEGQLQTAIDIFTGDHPKKFLHQLISGQLDVDRMDYLSRDSFFTGVSEGVIGYDRIIKMLAVQDGELMVEEKGIYSVEKFLVARRLMYWQAYLHKTVLAAENMLMLTIRRAREIGALSPSEPLNFFLQMPSEELLQPHWLDTFCRLDDCDIMMAIKSWATHDDKILSLLGRSIVERRPYRLQFLPDPPEQELLQQKTAQACLKLDVPPELGHYLVFSGLAENSTYRINDEKIHILFKDGTVKDISQVDDALVHRHMVMPVKKYYICSVKL